MPSFKKMRISGSPRNLLAAAIIVFWSCSAANLPTATATADSIHHDASTHVCEWDGAECALRGDYLIHLGAFSGLKQAEETFNLCFDRDASKCGGQARKSAVAPRAPVATPAEGAPGPAARTAPVLASQPGIIPGTQIQTAPLKIPLAGTVGEPPEAGAAILQGMFVLLGVPLHSQLKER
jgi:hypothetical protein